MSNVQAASNTPFQVINQSKPANFVKDNPGLSAGAAVGAGIIAKNVADHSQLAATAVKKGLVPVVGAGVAALGATMIHDAVAGDNDSGLEKLGKAAGGGALILGGAEIAARPFGASPLKALGRIASSPVAQGVLMASPGLAAAAWGAQDIKENGLTLANTLAVGAGSSWSALQVPLATMEMTGAGSKMTELAFKGSAVVGGASLGLGAAVMGREAYENMQEGNWGKAAALGGGAAVAGVGSAHLLGNATGISALSNLAGKAMKNPMLAGSIAVVGLTGVAYAAYNAKEE